MRYFFVLGLFVAVAACDHAKDAKSRVSASPAEMAAKPLELPMFGLAGTVPGSDEEPTVNVGPLAVVTVTAAGFAVDVGAPGQFDPKTAKDGHENAVMHSGRNEKSETLADGWSVTFDNSSGGGNYFARVYRTIGGKPYFCSASQPKPEQRDGALRFCKSLRAN